MGSRSVSNCRGLFHWEGLLVVVLLLTFWSPPTTATIEVMSTFAAVGDDALLQIKNKPPEVAGIMWYKGMGVDHKNIIAFYITRPHFHLSGPEYSGEQMITDDGSLLLKNVTKKDAGTYTAVAHFLDSETQTGFGHLGVYDGDEWRKLIKLFKKIKELVVQEKNVVAPEPQKSHHGPQQERGLWG